MLGELTKSKNPDMVAEVYGKLRDGNGIKIRLSNVEFVSDALFRKWKGVLWKHGYNASVSHDANMQEVTIVAYHRYGWMNIMAAIGIAYLIVKVVMYYV